MLINILVSIFLWTLILAALLRMLGEWQAIPAGLRDTPVIQWITGQEPLRRSYTPARREYLAIFGMALLFRLCLYLLSCLIIMMLGSEEQFTLNDFFTHWERWDATNYLRIMNGGYTSFNVKGEYSMLVFFPLYPWAGRLLKLVIFHDKTALLLLSSLFYAIACCYFYAFVSLDYGRRIARKSVLYLSIFPFAFFMGAMMNESTLFLTLSMTLYYGKKHRWLAAGICGFFAAISRINGIFVMIPVLIEFVRHHALIPRLKQKAWKEVEEIFFKKALCLALPLLGILLYLFLNWKIGGHPFKFMELEEKIWGQHTLYFGQGFANIWNQAVSPDVKSTMKACIWIPQILIYLLSFGLLAYGFRRHSSMYTIYYIAGIILAVSISWPISGARYMSCTLPMFIFLADLSERHKQADKWITVLFSISFGIYFVGYLLAKQIM